MNSVRAISEFDSPLATSLRMSSSRGVNRSGPGTTVDLTEVRSSISRRVMEGASSASPTVTIRTASPPPRTEDPVLAVTPLATLAVAGLFVWTLAAGLVTARSTRASIAVPDGLPAV